MDTIRPNYFENKKKIHWFSPITPSICTLVQCNKGELILDSVVVCIISAALNQWLQML